MNPKAPGPSSSSAGENDTPPSVSGLTSNNGHGSENTSSSHAVPSVNPLGQPPLPSTTPGSIAQANLFDSPQRLSATTIVLGATGVMLVGLVLNLSWLGFLGAAIALITSVSILWAPFLRPFLSEIVSSQEAAIPIAFVGGFIALAALLKLIGIDRWFSGLVQSANWDAVGALGEVFGAVGQILIAVLALYIAWRQYVIEKDLTTQQNLITQQQTIDSFFQGISDLVLDDEGLLEDWPQERAIAEGRTAAILSSVDGGGKAKIIRFLSRARLLSPLKRDQRLGRAILDGTGGYEEDRVYGVRVIDLGVMLAGADLSKTDLRWTDLSEINLIRANLSSCDLVRTNLSGTILCQVSLRGADLNGTRFFYGKAETASPRSKTELPDYRSGAFTGAVIEGADFTNAVHMSQEQREYCCAWGGAKTRSSIPGGCEGIPNKLGR
ncbi:MAG: pentapeptide repeat-containing protein [Leptolyngbya sp. BL-A-14]